MNVSTKRWFDCLPPRSRPAGLHAIRGVTRAPGRARIRRGEKKEPAEGDDVITGETINRIPGFLPFSQKTPTKIGKKP